MLCYVMLVESSIAHYHHWSLSALEKAQPWNPVSVPAPHYLSCAPSFSIENIF